MWHRSVCLALVVSLSAPCAIAAVPGLPLLPSLPALLKKAKSPVGPKGQKAVTPASRPVVSDEYEISKPVRQPEEQTLSIAPAPITAQLYGARPASEDTALVAAPSPAGLQASKEPSAATATALMGPPEEKAAVVSTPKTALGTDSSSSSEEKPLAEPVKPVVVATEPLVAPPAVAPAMSSGAPKASRLLAPASSITQEDGYYLPLSCVEFDNSADSVEYQVKKGGVIERKAVPPEKKLTTFAVSPGESLRATLKRWAAPDYAFLWEASPEVDFTFRTAAQFGKDRTTAVKALIEAVRGTVNLQLSVYNKNSVWVVRGEIPDSLCP